MRSISPESACQSAKNLQEGFERRIRLLMLTPHCHGGWHHYSAALCNALAKHPLVEAVDYLIVFREQQTRGVGSEEYEILDPAVRVAYLAPAGRLNRFQKYRLFVRNLLHWSWLLWCDRYDVIHIQTVSYDNFRRFNLLLLLWFKIIGVSMVRTVHEIVVPFREHQPGAQGRCLSYLEWRIPDHFIVHDTMMQHRMRREIRQEENRISVIPHGNYLTFRNHLPEGHDDYRIYSTNQVPVILFFGVRRHKGLSIFLEAWRMLKSERHLFRALIAGAVGEIELAEEARQLPDVEVDAGYIPTSNLWQYFSRCSFAVMPYLTGTTSGAVHLAFTFKRPVIVSDLDCFREMVIPDKTGIVVRRGDAAALKQAIVELANNPGRCRDMGEAGFHLESASRYAWNTISNDTVKAYSALPHTRARKAMIALPVQLPTRNP
jgi:glycosyltransferase involved in cell wall biosynthesis